MKEAIVLYKSGESMQQEHIEEYFDKAFEILMKNEGGYVNNPCDAGGETKYGISKRSYPNLDIKHLTLIQAKSIYYKDYWLQNKCNVIDDFSLAQKLFDFSVNTGCKQAALLLQRALKSAGCPVDEDSVIGPKTLAAVKKADPACLLSAFKSEAAGYYRLIAANQNNEVFLKGWLNRAYA